MCITLRVFKSKKPYFSNDKYRFKMLRKPDDPTITKAVAVSYFVQSFEWMLNRWTKSVGPVRPKRIDCHGFSSKAHDHGFHVFINRINAAERVKHSNNGLVGVFKVKNFIASGYFNCDKCETWKDAKLVAIYSAGGTLLKASPDYTGPKRIKTS